MYFEKEPDLFKILSFIIAGIPYAKLMLFYWTRKKTSQLFFELKRLCN